MDHSEGDPIADRDRVLEGLAAVAVGCAEMGASDGEIVGAVGDCMGRLGLASAADVRDVAAAIARLPQPVDEPFDVRERRRPIEEMVGLASPEEQLSAALRARAALEAFADVLDVS